MNKVILNGRVGQDPIIRTFSNGDKVANLALATNEGYFNKENDTWVDRTEWHKLVAHKRIAERIEQKVTKGTELLVEGKLQTRKYEKDGTTVYSTEIVLMSLKIFGQSNVNGADQSGRVRTESSSREDFNDFPSGVGGDFLNDDLPF